MKSFCLTLSAFFVALGTLTAGLFYIPVGVSKCFPMQSLINCLAGVLIGPKKAAIVAFLIALLLNLLGTGSLLAFPGSIVGAYLAGMFFTRTKKEGASLLGEMIGTGLVAALIASFMSTYLMGKTVPFYFFVIPFGMSALGCDLLAGLIMNSPLMTAVKKRLEKLAWALE